MGPKSSKSVNKGGGGSSKKGGASVKSDSSCSVSSTPDPDYAQALKDLKLQWLRYYIIV